MARGAPSWVSFAYGFQMHLSAAPLLLVACLALASCTSSDPASVAAGIAGKETTGSIKPPVPALGVGDTSEAGGNSQQHVEQLAWAGEELRPGAFERTVTVGMPLPNDRQIAALMPDSPMRVYAQKFRDAKPIDFGRVTPKSYPVHGVDVSRWQGVIDWPKLRRQGANFAYIKATDGGDHLDPMFKTNWNRAKAAGLKRGAYHFFYWCRYASHQADWFIQNVPRDPDALPPVIDVEWNHDSSCRQNLSRAKVLEKMQVFMDRIERHYGKRPVIYTAPDFYADNLKGEFLDYPFWLRAVAQHPSKVYPGRKWLFWQYSGSGLSHGVDNKIDLNVFHGSVKQWRRWIGSDGMVAQN